MSRNKILSQDAYSYILDLILTKQLLPGARVPEIKIAESLQISRTPVREALQQLSNEGIIEIKANHFVQVTNFTPSMIREIGTLRLTLDTASTKLALLYGSHIDFLNLKDLAQKSIDAFYSGDNDLRRKLDCDFHLELSRISNNDLLFKFQSELYLRVQFILVYHNSKVRSSIDHIRQHLEFTEALIERDEDKALSILKKHLIDYYDLINYYPSTFLSNF